MGNKNQTLRGCQRTNVLMNMDSLVASHFSIPSFKNYYSGCGGVCEDIVNIVSSEEALHLFRLIVPLLMH